MSHTKVAFLGPLGTYSHLVAEKRFGRDCHMTPMSTITDVCTFVAERPDRRGVIPIENSSGGAIYETVDILMQGEPRISILEELGLNVKLALIGRKGEKIRLLFSHFAPMEHCAPWIHKHLPSVQRHTVSSTAVAAARAAELRGAACLGNRRLASLYGLDILEYPVQADLANLTLFIAIGGKRRIHANGAQTTLAVRLPNTPGSLCSFLESFRNHDVNLTRLISRPIRGCPRQYAFLVDIEGGLHQQKVQHALADAARVSAECRTVGSYPIRRPYNS